MRIEEGDLDDQALKLFFASPKLNEIEFILPTVGWRFHRHRFPQKIPGRREERA